MTLKFITVLELVAVHANIFIKLSGAVYELSTTTSPYLATVKNPKIWFCCFDLRPII